MNFGDSIKKIRIEKGLTMREVERRSGISQAYLSQIENGKRSTPKYDTVIKLSKGLGVNPVKLLIKAGYGQEAKELDFMVHNSKKQANQDIRKFDVSGCNSTNLSELLCSNRKDIYFKKHLLTSEEKKKIIKIIETIIN
ncbi:helix-turn-helix domain-containing protein [Halobacillus yeomjeoni]|uniref:Helix-turn-helix transcriptional regulator n=1 Tax=Halobacillus yeomjeoni TaxID=311194 RepID=A0A931HSL0_9BACI|nr:helix-turn-helix transcriptional regulator [Halobacillus yeomjeoni]MBH0228832.1 helix-turn-helix transcriptional regulator [Halobacillus yeomjeoni]